MLKHWYYNRKQFEAITGHAFNAREVFAYSTFPSFNGDGYTISVYETDDETASLFIKAGETFFSGYPNTLEAKTPGWSSTKWQNSPLKAAEWE